MATITKGKTFTNGELVTPATIHQLVDAATISGIVNADISASAAIVDTKLAQISTVGKVLPAAVAGTAVITTDARLSDARTPTSHNHDASNINAGTLANDRLPARLQAAAQTISDWNDALENGWYQGNQAANAPDGVLDWWLGYVEAYNALWVTQTVHRFTMDTPANTDIWRRSSSDGGGFRIWNAWYKLQLSQAEQDARYQASGSYAAASHTHGNITNAGAIGTTANLPVVTGASGQLTTINSGQSGQILSSAGPNSAPYWANPVSSGSTVISPNNIANTVVQRNAVGSFWANTLTINGLNALDVSDSIMFAVTPSNIGNTTIGLPAVSSGTPFVDFYRDGVDVGKITTNGNNSVSYSTSSDYRLKTNIEPLTAAVSRLLQIPVHRFNWLAAPTAPKVDGFLAHEAQAIVPESVTGAKDAEKTEEYEVTPAVKDENCEIVTPAVMGTRTVPEYQGIDQSKLVPLLVAAVQELAARVAALEAR